MVQVGEAAFHQGADEVQGEGGALVAAQQELRVGRARLGGELRPVDDVAAIGGQANAVARLLAGGARLGVLPGEAADADHGPLRAHHQHQAHLQQHLERVGDAGGRAIHEALGAIAALQHEAGAGGGFGELVAQVHDLPTGHQRRQLAQLGQHALERGGVGILGLLQGGPLPPGIRRPLGDNAPAFDGHDFDLSTG